MNILKIFPLLFFLSLSAYSSEVKDFAYSKQWLKLLHMQKGWFGYSSRADGPMFFLSKSGKSDPLAELEATIEAFRRPKKKKEQKWHDQCSFPARKIAIERVLGLKFPEIECTDFIWWKNRLNAKGLSLVFSSYYPNNPASMFGHTLLKFNSDQASGKLTDFSMNYAADTQGDGGVAYILKGMLGGFYGYFSTEPYYLKVNDYVNGESRDLWEYQLKLSDNQLELLLAHMWELKTNTFFDYYFFDENCSFVLLSILEVADPNWNLTRGFTFYAMPIDTIKRVAKAGLVGDVYYRPSFKKKMLARKNTLSPEQYKNFIALINNKIPIKQIKDRNVLEAALAFTRYKRYENNDSHQTTKEAKKRIFKLIRARAKLGGMSTFRETEIVERYQVFDPLKGHDSFAIQLGSGYSHHQKTFAEAKFRFALREHLNIDFGYPDFSELQVFATRLRYYRESKKLKLEEQTWISMLSLTPFSSIDPELSWGFSLRSIRPKDFLSTSTLSHRGNFITGLNTFLWNDKMILLGLFSINLEQNNDLPKDGYRIGPGLRFGAMLKPHPLTMFNLLWEGLYDIRKTFDNDIRHHITAGGAFRIKKNWEFQVRADHFSSSVSGLEREQEAKLNLIHFF
jgi:hypothetical protein